MLDRPHRHPYCTTLLIRVLILTNNQTHRLSNYMTQKTPSARTPVSWLISSKSSSKNTPQILVSYLIKRLSQTSGTNGCLSCLQTV